jgi:hypothetical protein
MHQSLEGRISGVERRLTRLEQAPRIWQRWNGVDFDMGSREAQTRILGWMFLIVSLLGLLGGWSTMGTTVTFLLAVALLCGIWLIVAASGLVAPSETYLQLAREHRAAKPTHAQGVHKRHGGWLSGTRLTPSQLSLLGGALLLAAVGGAYLAALVQDVVLAAIPAAFGLALLGAWAGMRRRHDLFLLATAAFALLLVVLPAPLEAMITLLAGSAILWIAAWPGESRVVTSAVGLATVLVAFGQTYGHSDSFDIPTQFAVACSTLMGFLLTALPYAVARRTLKDRDIARVTLVTVPVLVVLSLTTVGPYSAFENLLTALLVIVAGYLTLAYVAWLGNGRLSYVKYFATGALLALLAAMYLVLDPISLTLFWFVIALGVSAAGFLLPSASARMSGLLLTGITVVHYLVLIMNAPQVSGPALLRDRFWLGCVIALFLPALAIWFQEAKVRGVERRLIPSLTTTLVAAAYFILLALGYLDLTGVSQSLFWLLATAGCWAVAKFSGQVLLRKKSVFIGLLVVIKLLTFDLATLDSAERAYVVVIVAVTLIGLGLSSPRMNWSKQVISK